MNRFSQIRNVAFLLTALVATVSASLGQSNAPENLSQMPHYLVVGPNPAIQNITYPAGYNLIVLGGILTERLRVAQPGSQYWADYVFKPNYNLSSLSKVKSYIQQHGHLPGIPSSQEVEKEGVDVVQMQAKLLEKIEELTLHLIRQEEEIQQLKKQVGKAPKYINH